MSAEAEAGEILVRIMGQGISEMIRVSGTGAMVAGRAAVSLLTFCYAVKVGGRPAEIARNPGGMAIITIPEEKLQEFKQAAKAYKLQFFSVNSKSYDEGYLDLCMKAEDVATCQRILELTGITAVQVSGTTTTVLDQAATCVRSSQTFEEAAEKLKTKGQSIEEAFNRHTDKDYARDMPYVLCDRENPKNYVLVHPAKAVFEGQEYTKSTYQVYRNGEPVAIYDDGRFEGRPGNFWFNIRQKIVEGAALPAEDIVYFKNVDDHSAYVALADGKKPVQAVSVNVDSNDLAVDIQAAVTAVGAERKVPADAQARTTSQAAASGNGQRTGENEPKKNMTTMKMTDGNPSEITFEERSEGLKKYSQTFDASLNRKTDKDFAQKEPYYLCDRQNPTSYIEVTPQRAEFNGRPYTRSTYRVYKNGEYAGTFDDGKSNQRDQFYWGNLKDKMQSAGGFANDMVYFKNLDSLKEYQQLYTKGQASPEPNLVKNLEELSGSFLQDINTDVKPKRKGETYTPGGVKAFAAEYKEANPKTDTELSKIVAAKLEELRGMQR
ncbi:DUF3801 domain-containing protein [Ihubacter sp. mB4P-1]|uniref:DUF3801 domain-containing protein n=1 Tax=Ihubacter sp. mB4P-1 TaxID=3242370 RepID=UPI003C7ED346